VALSRSLRQATERVPDDQTALPIAALWGDASKGSADVMAMRGSHCRKKLGSDSVMRVS
jgi:TnpA family transposase